MANADTPCGLRPVKTGSGPWNGQTIRCYIPSTYATALYVGDPVALAGAANTEGDCPTVGLATAGDGNMVFGVITGFEPLPTNLNITYHPASTAQYCSVSVGTETIYEIQGSSSAALSTASIGLNANLVSGTGSTTSGLSGWEMDTGDSDAPDADASNQLLIVGASSRPDNEVASVHAKWLVKINQSGFGQGALGVS